MLSSDVNERMVANEFQRLLVAFGLSTASASVTNELIALLRREERYDENTGNWR